MLIEFLIWTLMLYWIHRVAHVVLGVRALHLDHHSFVLRSKAMRWHPNNLLLFNDTWRSTADLWITEVVPTLLFSWVFDAWWLSLAYYVWAAFFQEWLEHNKAVCFKPFSCGRWHLLHHSNPRCNFGLFFCFWDILFLTNCVTQ